MPLSTLFKWTPIEERLVFAFGIFFFHVFEKTIKDEWAAVMNRLLREVEF